MSSVTTYDPAAPVMPAPPEGVLYEIVDGRYEELPEMGTQAAVVASRLSQRLGNFAQEKHLGEVVTEALSGLTPKSRRKHRPDGAWGGTLSAEGTAVEVAGVAREAGPGMHAVAVELARLWVAARQKGKPKG